jgi:hypothetical protein
MFYQQQQQQQQSSIIKLKSCVENSVEKKEVRFIAGWEILRTSNVELCVLVARRPIIDIRLIRTDL